MAIGRAQQQVADVALGVAQLLRRRCAHPDHFGAFLDLGCHRAGEVLTQRPGDRFWVDTLERRFGPIHVNFQRVAGWLDAVAYVHHACDHANRLSSLRGQRLQLAGVVGEDLDLHRLRHRSQIADQVLHQLRELDLHPRHELFHVVAHVVHDFFDRPPRRRFQADKKVAFVCLGDTAAELGAGAT